MLYADGTSSFDFNQLSHGFVLLPITQSTNPFFDWDARHSPEADIHDIFAFVAKRKKRVQTELEEALRAYGFEIFHLPHPIDKKSPNDDFTIDFKSRVVLISTRLREDTQNNFLKKQLSYLRRYGKNGGGMSLRFYYSDDGIHED